LLHLMSGSSTDYPPPKINDLFRRDYVFRFAVPVPLITFLPSRRG
jgi:hypothetical protein